tara:strand:+ start:6872 stop:7720 length:849 start_codon:yes stop_codon:yes gene_type:complete
VNKSVKFKIANEKQVISLTTLFKNVYKKNILKKELEWRYLNNPNNRGEIFNCIALNKNHKIVGHTAFIKQYFRYQDTTISGALTSGSAVESDYTGIFAPMYSFLEQSFKDKFDFFYGFPNKKSFPFFKKIFNYKSSNFIQTSIKFGLNNYALDKICSLIQNQKISRDHSYLKWRIEQSPINEYYSYVYNGNIIIWKPFLNGECDIVGILPSKEIVNIQSKDIPINSNLNLFITSLGNADSNALLRLFSNKNSDNFFIYKNSNSSNSKIDEMNYFQMLDIDIF